MIVFCRLLGAFLLATTFHAYAYGEEKKMCYFPFLEICGPAHDKCGMTELSSEVQWQAIEWDEEGYETRVKPYFIYDDCPNGKTEGWADDMDAEENCGAAAIQGPGATKLPVIVGVVVTKTCWRERPCMHTAQLSTMVSGTYYEHYKDSGGNWVPDTSKAHYSYRAICGSFGSSNTALDILHQISWTPCVTSENCQ